MEKYPTQPGYRATLTARQSEYAELMKRGELQPFVFPRDFISIFIVIAALLVPWSRYHLFKYVRYLAFFAALYLNTSTIKHSRALAFSDGYGVGLAFIWHTIWSAAILVFNDAQRDFKRIERTFINPKAEPNGAPLATTQIDSTQVRHRTRKKVGETQSQYAVKNDGTTESSADDYGHDVQYLASYHWQSYPKRFLHRLTWVLDVTTLTFRGSGWNWGNPVLPPVVADSASTRAAFKSAWVTTTINYLGLDLLKVLTMKDPYFWGLVDSPPPPLFTFFGRYAGFAALVYRLLICCFGIMFALKGAYGFVCMVYLGIGLSLGPRTSIKIPIEAPWLYTDFFGPFLTSLFEGGLAGAWGRWWHQNFRFGFVAPADWLLSKFPVSLQTKSQLVALRVIIAFVLSGAIHACGSYTQFADTKPLSGPFLFFVLQIPGILIQRLPAYISPRLLARLPKWIRQWTNLAFSIAWILLTGPLVADDFSRGGLWLFEPIPISPLRGLGFGAHDEGWWCWHGKWFKSWAGERWWQRGFQIL